MLKDIIRSLREMHRFTQKEVADYLHIQRATYTRYETGTNSLSFDALCKLADLYGVTTDFLLERDMPLAQNHNQEFMLLYNHALPFLQDIVLEILKKGQILEQKECIKGDKRSIPIFTKDLLGLPIQSIEKESLEKNDFYKNKVYTGDFGVVAYDESMADENIHLGDYVIFRPQSSVISGDIVLVILDDHMMIRKISKENNEVLLIAANAEYKPKNCSEGEFCIIGRMIRVIRDNDKT